MTTYFHGLILNLFNSLMIDFGITISVFGFLGLYGGSVDTYVLLQPYKSGTIRKRNLKQDHLHLIIITVSRSKYFVDI